MAINKFIIALFFSFILLFEINSFAQSKTENIVSSLNKVIIPIKTFNADSSFDDIDFIEETLKEKAIIALGEVTHGTREVFNYKDRLVRFLVSNLDYKAIAFESDFIALEKIDEYINGKINRLSNLSETPLHLDNIKMIEWLKNFNLSQSEENKIHVYGLEARGFNNISAKILETFSDLDFNDKKILERLKTVSYTEIKKEDINLLKNTIANLKNGKKGAIQLHYINLLAQNTDIFYDQKIGVRDEYMAQNASWIKEKTRNNKLIVWAHNGHVAKTALYKKPSMGNFLSEKYKAKYFVIATDFNHGEVSVRKYIAKDKPIGNFAPLYYSEVNSDKAYEYYFKQSKYKNFILNVNSASQNPVLHSFIINKMNMRMIGALSTPEYTKLSIATNFDLIVYFDKTTSSK